MRPAFNNCLARLFQGSVPEPDPPSPQGEHDPRAARRRPDAASPTFLLQVEAPCDMNEGYTFLVRRSSTNTFGDDEVAVTVPRGGVRQGQVFWGAVTGTSLRIRPSSIRSFTSLDTATAAAAAAVVVNTSETTPLVLRPGANTRGDWSSSSSAVSTTSQWKTPLWGVFRQGLCHALGALCCPQLMVAQVMTRLRRNGMISLHPVTNDPGSCCCSCHHKSLGLVAAMVCGFWILSLWVLLPFIFAFEEDDTIPLSTATSADDNNDDQLQKMTQLGRTIIRLVYAAISCLFAFYTLYMLTTLRNLIRHKYQIPPAALDCCCSRRLCCCDQHQYEYMEDCCVSMLCCCCVASQLALQTADVTRAQQRCCSPYGTDNDDSNDEHSTATETCSRSDSPSSLANVT